MNIFPKIFKRNDARISRVRQGCGFTLIELLVVISIISLISSAVLASINRARDRARANKLIADFDSVRKQIELVRNGRLIDVTNNGCSDCICRSVANIHTLPATDACIINLTNSWVARIGFSVLPRDPWGNPYTLDENEHESSNADCRYDQAVSPGPDHMLTYGGDDVVYNIPHFFCMP
jgi:prepilin-type N-terminal cleavage/methylation domain-containing protein